ncbi:Hypothetical Protein FCC1311_059772 [Hondaea fermentalgiana]|uniref:Uncharacterized protein n=1 Tax=Hondaea fermentalgiana TaxID=2315210 RepID=A0A2R5GFR2_9STRA|nr:Hypothetical Protein FCC1311_059772 [Hondaea fermentalgiana]|eukprot:GBG29756.1 Hypothetical Protein FCC1311_059772 [Hondaea fermentalgiana]
MVASLHVRQRMLVTFALVTFLAAKTYLSFSSELAWNDIAEGSRGSLALSAACSDAASTPQQPQLRRPCADEVKSWRNFILEDDHEPVSMWETAADNLGMAMSNPQQFYVEVQADIVFCSDGWLDRILEPLRKYSVLFAVGGRCGHALRGPVPHSVKGPCRAMLEPHSAEFVAQWDHEIDIVQTVNRGPYAVRAKAIQEMGFFDEVHFLIAEDEHDLHRRATFLKWNFAFRFVDMYHLQGLKMSSNSFIPSRYQNLSAQYKIEHRARKSSNVKCPYPRFAKPPMRVAEEGEKWPI